jgi:hypothetical protein
VITEICEATDREVRKLLPILSDEIELAAQTGTRVIPETGETATAVGSRRIRWVVNPSLHGGLASIARAQLRCTLFHELHHLARGSVIEGGGPKPTLMDAVISEGLATAFERDAGGRKSPWSEYPLEVTSWVEELLQVPATASHRSWMFSHPDGRRWIGYRAGVYIADQAQRNAGLSAVDLVRASTYEVLRLAGIADRGMIAVLKVPST